jgi:hypothetical protein
MVLFLLIAVFVVAAACGYYLSGWRGMAMVALVLLLCLVAAVAAIGEGAILVAAYGGGPVLLVAALAYALGAKFRPDDDAA